MIGRTRNWIKAGQLNQRVRATWHLPINQADELSSIAKVCKIIGVSWSIFFHYKDAVDEYGVEALIDKNSHVHNSHFMCRMNLDILNYCSHGRG